MGRAYGLSLLGSGAGIAPGPPGTSLFGGGTRFAFPPSNGRFAPCLPFSGAKKPRPATKGAHPLGFPDERLPAASREEQFVPSVPPIGTFLRRLSSLFLMILIPPTPLSESRGSSMTPSEQWPLRYGGLWAIPPPCPSHGSMSFLRLKARHMNPHEMAESHPL